MRTRQTDLLFHQVEIIQEPFARRATAPPFGLSFGHQIVGLDQNLFVVRQSRQQPIRTGLGFQPMLFRQGDRMPAQLFIAEQLRAQRHIRRARARPTPPFPPTLAM